MLADDRTTQEMESLFYDLGGDDGEDDPSLPYLVLLHRAVSDARQEQIGDVAWRKKYEGLELENF